MLLKCGIVLCERSRASLCEWEYLEVNAGHLIISRGQKPGGEIVDRRGGLYLREKERNESQVS